MSDWIPVKERMPEDDRRVLVVGPRGGMAIGRKDYKPTGDRAWFSVGDGRIMAATHWMPLPDPPKEKVHD